MGEDEPKLSFIASEISCLAVPTDGTNCSLQSLLSHWIVRTYTCLQQPAKQTRKTTVWGPSPPLRCLSQAPSYKKIRNFYARSFPHTLSCVITFFYQRGGRSAFHGKLVISSQIGRGRWRTSRARRPVLPFK